MNNKTKYIIFSLLTILLIIVIVAVILILIKKDTSKPVEMPTNSQEENNTIIVGMDENTQTPTEPEPEPEPEPEDPFAGYDEADMTAYINNLNMEVGTLYIPRTNLTTQVYSRQTLEKLEKMPCVLYSSGGINKKGVTLITGHNRRNGKLFSNNKKLKVGDVFYFKDYEGLELKYNITDKYITTEYDTGFLNIETNVPIIVLSCCTDASNKERIIIIGRAEV